jgi:hypothetical protein
LDIFRYGGGGDQTLLGLQTQERCVGNGRLANKQPTAIQRHHLASWAQDPCLQKLHGISKATHTIKKIKIKKAIRKGSVAASPQLFFTDKQISKCDLLLCSLPPLHSHSRTNGTLSKDKVKVAQ